MRIVTGAFIERDLTDVYPNPINAKITIHDRYDFFRLPKVGIIDEVINLENVSIEEACKKALEVIAEHDLKPKRGKKFLQMGWFTHDEHEEEVYQPEKANDIYIPCQPVPSHEKTDPYGQPRLVYIQVETDNL